MTITFAQLIYFGYFLIGAICAWATVQGLRG